MKKISLLALLIVLILGITPACSDKGGGDCTETGLRFTTTPVLGSTELPAPGPDFALQVVITAPVPAAGVTITVTAKPENPANATAFFSETRNVTAASNTFTITGTPQNVISIVTITATSRSCGTNKFSGSYRYSRK